MPLICWHFISNLEILNILPFVLNVCLGPGLNENKYKKTKETSEIFNVIS